MLSSSACIDTAPSSDRFGICGRRLKAVNILKYNSFVGSIRELSCLHAHVAVPRNENMGSCTDFLPLANMIYPWANGGKYCGCQTGGKGTDSAIEVDREEFGGRRNLGGLMMAQACVNRPGRDGPKRSRQ